MALQTWFLAQELQEMLYCEIVISFEMKGGKKQAAFGPIILRAGKNSIFLWETHP